MGLSQQFRFLLDALPEVHFFAKDLEHRFVAASPDIVRRLGCKDENDLLGRRDRDFYPPHLAASIEADDDAVFATGQPLLNRLETWFDNSRLLDWFVTTKFPIRDAEGKVIGVMGFVRPYEGKDGRRQAWSTGPGFSRAVDHIRHHYGEPINVEELARKAALSMRQLHRKFIDAFGMPAPEFILRTRMQAACEMLASGHKSVGEIALECGFSDQSAFTRNFKRLIGTTPGAFQRGQLIPQNVSKSPNNVR